MRFITYDTKEKFLNENLDILLQDEAKNEVMIGIILEHEDFKVNNWLLGRIEEEEKVKIIFLVDDDKKGLLVYSPENYISEKVVNCLIDNFIKLEIDLTEIIANKEDAIKIANKYSAKSGKEMKIQGYSKILKLNEIKQDYILETNEVIEKITDEDLYLDNIKENVKEMYRDTFNIENCSDEEAERVSKIFFKKGIYVLKNNNEIVSQIVTVRKQINSCAIGGIITLERHRGKGYAKRFLASICKELLNKGYKFIVLHANIKNAVAISLYEKIGFEIIEEQATIKFI